MEPQQSVSLYALSLCILFIWISNVYILGLSNIAKQDRGSNYILYSEILDAEHYYTILYYFGSSPNYYYGTQLLLLQSALNIYQTGQLMSNNHEEMTTMTSSHQPVTDWNKSLCSVVRGWNFSLRLPLWWPHEVTSGAAIKAGGNSEFIITVKPPSEKLQIIYIYLL